jgi:glutaredoxin
VEEDVEALPRHHRRRRKTLSEVSPWSTVPCLVLDGVIFSFVYGL